MTPPELQQSIAQSRAAALRLQQRDIDDVLASLDALAAAWLRPGSPWLQQALDSAPQTSGFSRPMIAHGLPLHFQPLGGGAIRHLLDAELGDRQVLNRAADGPPLIVHVLSGNIPGLVVAPVFLSLALKRAVLVKPAAGDPVVPQLLADSLAALDDDLRRCVVVAPWRGGDRTFEEIAFAAAAVVVASGADAAIEAIRARVPGRFIGHGHKVSFAVIAREALADGDSARRLAARLAYDVTLWDQQGCLSPQLCYVEAGGAIDAAAFADLVAAALSELALALPARRLSLDERAAVARFRQEAEWGANASLRLLASADSTAWSISVESGASFLPTCLNRCLRLKSIDDLAEITAALAPHRQHLEAAGIAAGHDRAAALAAALTSAGVHRLCAIGTMQTPGLEWRQGGRPRVAEWM